MIRVPVTTTRTYSRVPGTWYHIFSPRLIFQKREYNCSQSCVCCPFCRWVFSPLNAALRLLVVVLQVHTFAMLSGVARGRFEVCDSRPKRSPDK